QRCIDFAVNARFGRRVANWGELPMISRSIVTGAVLLIVLSLIGARSAGAANEAAMCDAAKRMADDQHQFFEDAKGDQLSDGKWKAKGKSQSQNCMVEAQGDEGDKSLTCTFKPTGHPNAVEFIAGFEKALGSCLRGVGYLRESVKITEDDGSATFGNSF